MNRPYQLLVFDWDGTLMDSADHIAQSIQQAAEYLNLPVPSDEAARDVIGLGLPEAVARLFPDADESVLTALSNGYTQRYLTSRKPTAFFTGTVDMLHHLVEQGYWLAVATGKSRRGLDRALRDTEMMDLFVATRCADESFSKPHPQMLLDILDYTGLSASQAVMIGDTEYDMQMAVNAGVDAVGVGCGVHTPERILAAGAEVCLPLTTDLSDYLANKPHGD